MQPIREHSVTIVSACWATVDWSGLKGGIRVRELISTEKKENRKSAGGKCIVEHSPQILALKEKVTHPPTYPPRSS